jgi:hypothetical protein
LASLLGTFGSGGSASSSAKPQTSNAKLARGYAATTQGPEGGRRARLGNAPIGAVLTTRTTCPPETPVPQIGGGCGGSPCSAGTDTSSCQVYNGNSCGGDTELDFTIDNKTGQDLQLSDANLWPGAYWCKKGVYPGRPPATLKPGESAQVAAGAQLLGGTEALIAYNTPNGEQLSVQAAAGDGLVRQNAVKCTPATSTSKWESVCRQHPEPGRSIYIDVLGPWKQNANVIGWLLQEKGGDNCVPGPFGCRGISAEPPPVTTRTRPTTIPP